MIFIYCSIARKYLKYLISKKYSIIHIIVSPNEEKSMYFLTVTNNNNQTIFIMSSQDNVRKFIKLTSLNTVGKFVDLQVYNPTMSHHTHFIHIKKKIVQSR